MSQASVGSDPHAGTARQVADGFSCRCRHSGLGAIWVDVSGDLNRANAPLLDQKLGEAQLDALLVVLDLSGLTSIDHVGQNVIADGTARARQMARRLVVVSDRARGNRMFVPSQASDAIEIGAPSQ